MIARVWSAQTTPAQLPEYVDHLKNHVLPALKSVEGYGGSMLLDRTTTEGAEVTVITFWRSLEAIRGFTGDDVEGAVVAEEAVALLSQFDRRVRHYVVTVRDEV